MENGFLDFDNENKMKKEIYIEMDSKENTKTMEYYIEKAAEKNDIVDYSSDSSESLYESDDDFNNFRDNLRYNNKHYYEKKKRLFYRRK